MGGSTFWKTNFAASTVLSLLRNASRTALKACASFRNVAISWAEKNYKRDTECHKPQGRTIFSLFFGIIQFSTCILVLTEKLPERITELRLEGEAHGASAARLTPSDSSCSRQCNV
jgi:hypothetical protein